MTSSKHISSADSTGSVAHQILQIVAQVPSGRVATYGQIAELAGRPRSARLVGRVLADAQEYGDYPCHRSVNHAGRLVPGWEDQAELLISEGVTLTDYADGPHVDLRRFQWEH